MSVQDESMSHLQLTKGSLNSIQLQVVVNYPLFYSNLQSPPQLIQHLLTMLHSSICVAFKLADNSLFGLYFPVAHEVFSPDKKEVIIGDSFDE